MTPAEIHLKSRPLAEANLPAWIRSVQADALIWAAFEALEHDDQSDIYLAIMDKANELDPPKP